MIVDQYQEWLNSNNLPHKCAYELLASGNLTQDQEAWLENFIDMWEEAEDAEVYAS